MISLDLVPPSSFVTFSRPIHQFSIQSMTLSFRVFSTPAATPLKSRFIFSFSTCPSSPYDVVSLHNPSPVSDHLRAAVSPVWAVRSGPPFSLNPTQICSLVLPLGREATRFQGVWIGVRRHPRHARQKRLDEVRVLGHGEEYGWVKMEGVVMDVLVSGDASSASSSSPKGSVKLLDLLLIVFHELGCFVAVCVPRIGGCDLMRKP